ncbi:hypothetical protein [Actinoplanes palleronii]|uniref:Uncharacterized protein n=1 Tax=Actinoplanes palleronii TaxID=113570 RepID=A0ABQ4BJC7_9ACTN|nr:hypothetical protein [Actinoplanes palleronii]GIE70779.1 hypothetical protein Apa02nite_068870 [Actinoplanes palleronii]
MTAPTYRRAPHRHVWQTRLGRWEWEVTDGIGGLVLAAGSTWTRAGAQIDSGIAQVLCVPSLELRLEWAADRLRREGLPVTVRQDEQGRVCVTPLCACSDAGHRHVMQEFARIVGSVRWEVR